MVVLVLLHFVESDNQVVLRRRLLVQEGDFIHRRRCRRRPSIQHLRAVTRPPPFCPWLKAEVTFDSLHRQKKNREKEGKVEIVAAANAVLPQTKVAPLLK